MARKDLLILAGALIALSILIQLFKLILKFDIKILETLSVAALGIGVVFLIFVYIRRKS